MATQNGVIQYRGRLGNLLGTRSRNGNSIRLQNFLDVDRIRSDPDFANTRKNMAEFRGASLGVDALMACLGANGKSFGGKRYRARLMKRVLEMLKLGNGVDGARSLEVMANGWSLNGVDLNHEDSLGSRFHAYLVPLVAVNSDRNTAVLTVPSFNAEEMVGAPLGASHFRLSLYAGALSDHVMGATGRYEPVNTSLHRLVSVDSTGPQAVAGANAGFTLTAALPGLPVLPSTAALVVSVSIQFYKEVNSVLGLLASGNALQILRVV